jgi:hypothetical protein
MIDRILGLSPKTLAIISGFAIPFMVHMLYWMYLRLCYALSPGGTLDTSGCLSIIWTGVYYGALGAFLVHIAWASVSHSKSGFAWALVTVGLSALNLTRDTWDRSPIDRLISMFGYQISRLAPYEPKDSPLPAHDSAVIPAILDWTRSRRRAVYR